MCVCKEMDWKLRVSHLRPRQKFALAVPAGTTSTCGLMRDLWAGAFKASPRLQLPPTALCRRRIQAAGNSFRHGTTYRFELHYQLQSDWMLMTDTAELCQAAASGQCHSYDRCGNLCLDRHGSPDEH